jgi:hypothetical protein
MKLLKPSTKPRAPEPAPAASPSMEEQLRAARQAAEEFVEARVQAIKASPEGQSLPIDFLRQNLYALARAKGCHRRCALSLLEAKR